MPTHYNWEPDEKRALDLYIKLLRAAESVAQRTQEPIDRSGLTVGQFGVLEALLHLGSLTVGELARKHLRSPNNLTVIVDNLERDGLVRRERNEKDRRQIIVHLTEAGRERIVSLFPAHVARVEEEFHILEPEDRDELERLLRMVGKQQR